MSDQPKPNFFIVGAPKCGTTALFDYLSQHPDVFVPSRKEFNYFCDDLTFNNGTDLYRFASLSEYLQHFAGWTCEKRIGEASVWYLLSRTAAANVSRFSPDARILIMIRNPVEMLYSLHSQLVKTGDEDIIDFEDALSAEQDRMRGSRIPKTDRSSSPVQGLQYTKVGMYSPQIIRYIEEFGAGGVKVIVYDDFRDSTLNTYLEVLEFLGLENTHTPKFSVVNANRAVKNEQLWRFIKFGPHSVRRVWRATLPAPVRGRILRWVNERNMIERPRQPMQPETRVYLQGVFKPEVERLSALLDRDLMPWVESANGRLCGAQGERAHA